MHKYQNKKLGLKANENIINGLKIFLIVILSVIVFYPPYFQGLFFEKQILPAGILILLLFLIFWFYIFYKGNFDLFKSSIEYVTLGFSFLYLISAFFAVHTRSAIIEWIKYIMYFAVFYMITVLADKLRTRIVFLWVIIASAIGVSIIGLDSANGGILVRALNKLLITLGARGDTFFGLFVDDRINSTLQYPNALATYVMAVFFIVIGFLTIQKKWWQKALSGILAFILLSTFFLTRSRGALIVGCISVFIFILVNPKGNRLKAFTHVVLISIPSLLLVLFINSFLSADSFSFYAFISLIIGLLASGFFAVIAEPVKNLVQKVNGKVYLIIFSVGFILAVTCIIYVMNQSVPIELSNYTMEEISHKELTKEFSLKPNKEYIISFNAQVKMEKEQPFAYILQIFTKNKNDILFSNRTLLYNKLFMGTEQEEHKQITFFVPKDSQLVSIVFINQYSGTGVILDNAKIIDVESGKLVKKIILKNKYNLDNAFSRFLNKSQLASSISRMIFYRDGIKIFGDRWLLGGGGGAWSYLYRQYQSYNYQSSQAHNYPLQLVIETGIVGILLLLFFVTTVLISYIRYYKKAKCFIQDTQAILYDDVQINKFLTPAIITSTATLLMHSAIDFDFSETAIFLLFWELIAIYNRNIRDFLTAKETWIIGGYDVKMPQKKKPKKMKNQFLTTVIVLLTIISLCLTSSLLIAAHSAQKSFLALREEDLEKSINNMEQAIALDKFNEEYVIGYKPIANRPDLMYGLADILLIKNDTMLIKEQSKQEVTQKELLLFQQQISKLNENIMRVEKKADNNLYLTMNLASYCFKLGNTEEGMEYLNKAISLFPYEPSLWHSKVNVYFQYLCQYLNNNDYENVQKYINLSMGVIDEAIQTNKENMNPFLFNKETINLYEKIRYIQNNLNRENRNVNTIVHNSMFDLDINQDNFPDQWYVYNPEIMSAFVEDGCLHINTSGRSCISARYPVSLKEGKAYEILIKLDKPIDYLGFHVVGITKDVIPLMQEGDYYTSELVVEETVNEANELRIYFESDCVIENIIIIEK